MPIDCAVKTATDQSCAECGTPLHEGDRLCRLCGHLFRVEARDDPLPAPSEPPPVAWAPDPEPVPVEGRVLGISEPWFFLIVGAVVAPVFALTPLLGLIGWYFAALVHEMGHCVAGWLVGHPAYPVLSLNGHAMAVGEPFSLLTCLAVFGAGVGASWYFLEGKVRWGVLGGLLVAYPLLVLTPLGEILTVVGGHLGELAFAGIFLFRTITGGFTSSRPERAMYSVMAWYLVGANVRLTGGLMLSNADRLHYAGNGSFGLTNDYIVLADQCLGWSLESVAALMTLVALAVVPGVLGGIAFLAHRARTA